MTINFLAWIKKLRRSKRSPQFRSAFISYAEAMESHKQELAQLKRLQSSAPSSKPKPPAGPPSTYLDGVLDPTPLQTRVLAVCHGMKLRANAEKAAAAQLRKIAESLVGFVAAEQGSIPATTDSGQVFVTPAKPQPSGGRLFINGIEQPQPTGSETLLEMVGYAIAEEPWEDEAKGAVLAVARWLRSQGAYTAVALLEREANK